MDIHLIFGILILVVSVVIHEAAHAYAAWKLGDSTPEFDGRLTLNPARHLDLVGSVIVPTLCFITGGFIIGWAKPVRFNPYNFKRFHRSGEAIVAAAGPFSNILLALGAIGAYHALGPAALVPAYSISMINLGLAAFNLLPVPPLDGSKILYFLLGVRGSAVRHFLDRYGLFVALAVIMFLSGPIGQGIHRLALTLLAW